MVKASHCLVNNAKSRNTFLALETSLKALMQPFRLAAVIVPWKSILHEPAKADDFVSTHYAA
jgi:hypothetical protein